MALIETKLKADIKSLAKEMTKFEDQDEALEHYSTELAKIITNYIKSATVTVNPGIAVSAPPPSGVGVTTAPGSGSLS